MIIHSKHQLQIPALQDQVATLLAPRYVVYTYMNLSVLILSAYLLVRFLMHQLLPVMREQSCAYTHPVNYIQ